MDTTPTDPLVGRLLDGRYRVESRIARGGMATVYLALDVRLDRTVAVKVMHRGLAEDPAFVRRFIGEAKSVASLSHPNVVQVFDQGTDGDVVYLSMEYVPGRTLRDVLRDRGRLPAREALEVMIPVLAALGAAHQAGLVHRDVKPENVLLADDGRVKVVDFGLARAVEATNQTRTGVMIGTIGYMSPEQVTSGAADARSDVYAAGIMLFELLTGRQPYEGETPMSIAYRHVHDTVPVPSALLPGSPPLLDTLVAQATARDPATRPADAKALLVAAVDAHRMLPRESGPIPSAPVPPLPLPSGPLSPPYGVAAHPAPVNPTLIQPRAEVLTGPAAGGAAAVPEPRRGRNRGSWVLLTVLALVMIAAVGVTGWLFSRETTVVVPSLIEQNVTLAAGEARQKGFAVEIGPAEHDEKVPKDVVLRTVPAAGAEVKPGSRLTLIASAGPKRVNVPNVVGLELNAAREKIAAAGLTVDDVKKQASETVPRGQVMRTSPAVGNRVKEGSKVDLYVSAGLLMPDVMGMHRDQARTVLESAGFVPEFVEQTDSAQPCTVIAQDPRAGAEVDKGSVARMTLSACNNGEWHWPWENNGENANEDDNVIVIPNVVYKDVRAARDELSAAGFRVKVKKGLNRGRVLAQLPPGGQQVPQGTQVTLWH
ncbi:serine/threonine protein kinase [Planomonospora parontospora subsp. parontospora]|uniref:non-specific serine/threonine protein kinase n=2 Tax=Planomonospora parontospora TaxID=58119 RepID=A0AA37F201_9ACTN|nr:Stk1 family PASTA domain-containing Ser/Thr kinase [Planomonospora parontospora]GGK47143.1 serine/threonine protein kinase [Planomonospora parontospora]GII06565.1 serine/threonine protein kinase [Planomonospora parontospora subsp. parontospora]